LIHCRLGRTGLVASRICLGGRDFGGANDEQACFAILDCAEAQGINFLDLADVYPVPPHPDTWGRCEEIAGRWLKGRRDRFIVATKGGARNGPGADGIGAGRKHLLRSCEASLRRLQTDRIDLFYIHHPDPDTPIAETLEALEGLIEAGQVRSVGFSNFESWRLAATMIEASPTLRRAVAGVQVRYNLLQRAPEHDLVPLCQELGLSVLPWNPLATGMLAGKYQRGPAPPAGSRFAEGEYGSRYQAYYWSDACFDVVEAMTETAKAEGCSPAQLAMAWILSRPGVAAAVAGASTPAQLKDTVAAVSLRPAAETLASLDALSEWTLWRPPTFRANPSLAPLGS
jgi:aryl-alcohol dehydrogenase (NADP+)